MATSYNGWTASPDRNDFGGLDNRVIPGTDVKLAPGVRNGDVATVLFYVAEQLHKRVEPAVAGTCWGYHYRPNVNNPDQISCHGSATAFDYNAPKHPNGAKNTFTKAQYAEIDKILAEVSNVVRQLRGYDEMHFEICADARAVNRVATLLRQGYTPKVSTGTRLLSYTPGEKMMSGDDVTQLQKVLAAWYPFLGLIADGMFGPATASAVRELQRRAGLVVDGVVGPMTRKVLGI